MLIPNVLTYGRKALARPLLLESFPVSLIIQSRLFLFDRLLAIIGTSAVAAPILTVHTGLPEGELCPGNIITYRSLIRLLRALLIFLIDRC